MSPPIGRRQALRTLGAPAVLPLLAPIHPWAPRQEGERAWQPRFLQPPEVETVAQLEFLKDCDCDLAQGFLIGRPMQADKIAALLQRRSASG